jgi:hypothetical protein
MKNCINAKCKQNNPQDTDQFYQNRNDCKTCHKENTGRRSIKNHNAKTWRQLNPDKVKKNWFKKYGISLTDFQLMIKQQDNKCAICKQPESAIDGKSKAIRDLSVDHCHKTGKVRGLLCSTCNRGLGYFKDQVDHLVSAANYLKGHEQTLQAHHSAHCLTRLDDLVPNES